MDQLLSTSDAGRILGVAAATVRLMQRRGDLPLAARTEGGIYLFRRADVEQLAARREHQREVLTAARS
jgi:DNA-binding transcriptional MerR regulator